MFLAFIVFNIIALPLGGIIGAKVLAADTVGAPPPEFAAIGAAVGEGSYGVDSGSLALPGTWTSIPEAEVAEATQGITNVASGLAPIILGIGILALVATWALAQRKTVATRGKTRWGLIGLGACWCPGLVDCSTSPARGAHRGRPDQLRHQHGSGLLIRIRIQRPGR